MAPWNRISREYWQKIYQAWNKKEAEAKAQEGCQHNLMIKRARESQRRVGRQSGEFVVQGSSQFEWQLSAKVASDCINLSIKQRSGEQAFYVT